MSKYSPDDWKANIDPYVIKLVKYNWGYFAKMCEAVAELYTAKGIKKAYDRGYRAGKKATPKPKR